MPIAPLKKRQVIATPIMAYQSPYPARYPWTGDAIRGGKPCGAGHAGRADLRLALALGHPLDFANPVGTTEQQEAEGRRAAR